MRQDEKVLVEGTESSNPNASDWVTEYKEDGTAIVNLRRKRAEEIKEKILQLRKEIDRDYYQIAGLLHEIWSENLYQDLGYSTFKEFSEEVVGFKERKARYLVAVYKWIEIDAGFRDTEWDKAIKNRLIEVGWSKLKELVGVITRSNADEWVAKAEMLSLEELKQEVKRYHQEMFLSAQKLSQKEGEDEGENVEIDGTVNGNLVDISTVQDGESPSVVVNSDGEVIAMGGAVSVADYEDLNTAFKPFTVHVTDDQRANIEKALHIAKILSDSTVDGHNLDLICTEFIASHAERGNVQDNIKFVLERLETLYGLKILAFTEKGQLVYGSENIDDVLKNLK